MAAGCLGAEEGAEISGRHVIQRIAGGAHRSHQIRHFIQIQGFPQAADMNVNRSKFDIDIVSPDRIEQLFA